MTTRPATLPRWASTPSALIITPLTGKQDIGHVEGEQPTPGSLNFLARWTYEWLSFLNAVLVDFGASSLAAANLTLTDDLVVGGDTLCTGPITATAGLTAGVNQHITVSGTGRFKHGDRVKNQNGAAATPSDATKWVVAAGGQGLQSTAADKAYLCPEFHVGERPKSVAISRSGDGAVDVTFTVYRNNANVTTSIGTDTDNNVAGGAPTVIDFADVALAAGDTIVLEVDANAANLILESVAWTFDQP